MNSHPSSTTAADRVDRYLDDVGRMLAGIGPADRADVLAGVREHVDTALGPGPWTDRAVDQVLLELGPPEEIAAAALEDLGRVVTGPGEMPPVAAPALARPWVRPVVAVALALGLAPTLLVVPGFLWFVPSGSYPLDVATYDVLWSTAALVLTPPGWLLLAGVILVTASPVFGRVDKVAAWSLLPWCTVVPALAALIARTADDCATGGPCTGTDRFTAQALMVGAGLVTAVGVVVVLVRLGRAPRPGDRDRWLAAAVAVGLLVSALPVATLPLTFRAGTYVSRSAGGLVAHADTLVRVLGPVLIATPVWVCVVVLLVRSRLWTRTAKLAGVVVVPALLVVAVLATAAPAALTPAVLTAGSWVSAVGALAVVAVAAWLWGTSLWRVDHGSADRPR
ncbi:HAAS signaling domain-containing protein [Georgenia subflava]|uniref:DUF1700 domain-containing protein n=1 Tax=Georgenia subflava TaxID=1622177 RepID=A0A6N7ECN7_9MICO|nr:hypothetical protein [Georgenia subflava]MPV35859.1 hypothetical protein [Georgenia subflava]